MISFIDDVFSELVFSDTHVVLDMEFDWLARNLYWVNADEVRNPRRF